MEPSKEHIRHILLFFLNKGKNASETVREIECVYGQGIISDSQCRRWFVKFRNGNTDLNDEQRSGRPEELEIDVLKTTIESNPTTTVRELAIELNVSHTTIHRHLKTLGMVIKLGKWVPHKLTAINLNQRINTCTSLLSRLNQKPFLNKIVTEDEKWVLYNNIKRRHQWLKPEQTPTTQPILNC